MKTTESLDVKLILRHLSTKTWLYPRGRLVACLLGLWMIVIHLFSPSIRIPARSAGVAPFKPIPVIHVPKVNRDDDEPTNYHNPSLNWVLLRSEGVSRAFHSGRWSVFAEGRMKMLRLAGRLRLSAGAVWGLEARTGQEG